MKSFGILSVLALAGSALSFQGGQQAFIKTPTHSVSTSETALNYDRYGYGYQGSPAVQDRERFEYGYRNRLGENRGYGRYDRYGYGGMDIYRGRDRLERQWARQGRYGPRRGSYNDYDRGYSNSRWYDEPRSGLSMYNYDRSDRYPRYTRRYNDYGYGRGNYPSGRYNRYSRRYGNGDRYEYGGGYGSYGYGGGVGLPSDQCLRDDASDRDFYSNSNYGRYGVYRNSYDRPYYTPYYNNNYW